MNDNSNERLYSIFEHELAICDLPFKDVFLNEPYKTYLYNEFCVSDLKPCYWLYREKYYSQDEYEKIMKEIIDNTPVNEGRDVVMASLVYHTEPELNLLKIQREFLEKSAKGELENQFFCTDILRTPTALLLLKIDEAVDIYKTSKFDLNNKDLYIKIISNYLKSITRDDLRAAIIDELVLDNLNFQLAWINKDEALKNNWKERKLEFDFLLKKNFTVSDKNARQVKQIDERMNLETILHPGLYQEAKEYYQTKKVKNKLKIGAQYGQLIREFANKNWVKPEYKKLSPKQLKILILNEFEINVSEETARRNPQGNVFIDLPSKQTIQMIM